MKALILLVVFSVVDIVLAICLPSSILARTFFCCMSLEIAIIGCILIYDVSKIKGKDKKKNSETENQ